ncbi:MAG TPA: protein-disulfide reductase DsbD, partial [Chromatiales bacterium]|nr:protein-disulfide reductase DsbD [Chromatiales bacterium]
QGCADLGVCYPPQRQVALLSLPAAAAAEKKPASGEAGAGGAAAALSRLAQALGTQEAGGEFLPPDEAYRLTVRPAGPGEVEARWEIAEGYYLYRDKFRFEPAAEGVTVGEPRFPPAEEKDDPFFGRVQVYHRAVAVMVPVQAPGGEARLQITYQGCAEAGLCYPPITKTVAVEVPAGEAPAQPAAPATQAPPAEAPAAPVSEQDRLSRFLVEQPLWLSAGLFFVLGLGLAFTPCVFPMFPILSSIIVGHGHRLTTGWAFALSLTYVLAMAVTYTVAGIVVALIGANLQAAFQDPWIIGAFAVVFALLALSMFGFYDLQMPSAIQSRLTQLANSQRGGHLIGVGIMGFLSALIVGPCVTAPLVAALIVIGQTGDPVLGGTALFALSLGMGTPLVIAGTSAGRLLPKAGPWMDAVKAVFGVLLLAVGVWLLERVIPVWAAMLLWAALLICSAVYMGALDPVPPGASGWRRLWKGLGWILLLWGALLIVGMAAGVRDTFQPLHGLLAPRAAAPGAAAAIEPEGLPFAHVKGVEQIEQAVAAAAREGRPVMLDFYADWCVSCKELEKLTFADTGVRAELEPFRLLQVDMTPWDEQDKAVAKRFGVIGPPAILFFGPDGRERREFRI